MQDIERVGDIPSLEQMEEVINIIKNQASQDEKYIFIVPLDIWNKIPEPKDNIYLDEFCTTPIKMEKEFVFSLDI